MIKFMNQGVTPLTKQEKAIQYIEENKLEEAAKLFVEIIDDNPDDPVGYVNFGNLLLQMKQFEEAERFFLKAIEIDDETATAFFSLGNLYYDRSLFQEAEKMFQQTIRLGLEDSDVYFMLGMTYVKREYHQLAVPFLQRATELKADIEKMFQYGLALAQTNYINEAETVFLQVLEKDHLHADSLYNLGIIEVNRKNNEKALEYFDKALFAQPNHALAKNAKENLATSNGER